MQSEESQEDSGTNSRNYISEDWYAVIRYDLESYIEHFREHVAFDER